MRPLYKKCWVTLLVLNVAFLLVSCDKQHYNTDPYSENKNDALSLIGFYWEGNEYVQFIDRHLFTTETFVGWNIIEVDEKEYIILHANVGGDNNLPMRISELWLIFPYQDVMLDKEYTTDIYPSVISGGAPYGSNIFLFNGEARNRFCTPIAASVRYSKKGKNIQGSFIATGVLEMADGGMKDVMLENGTFNLSYSSNFIKTYTLDKWLLDISYSRESI